MFIGTSPHFRSATVIEDHKDQSEYCERFSAMTNGGQCSLQNPTTGIFPYVR
jgi:hypothetical protein